MLRMKFVCACGVAVEMETDDIPIDYTYRTFRFELLSSLRDMHETGQMNGPFTIGDTTQIVCKFSSQPTSGSTPNRSNVPDVGSYDT
jgi:hypothetical protein